MRQKGKFKHREEFVKVSAIGNPAVNPDFNDATDLPVAREVAIGSVVALSEQLKLVANVGKPSDWPELAVFDCQACHHDLRSDSWRRQRGFQRRTPGRCLLYTSPSPRDGLLSRMPSSA